MKHKIVDESADKKYFTIIPNYILNHSTIWDREVYIQMKKVAGESGTCWVSKSNLARQCGISKRRLDLSINYLLKHKWISVEGRKKIDTNWGEQYVNVYKITDLWQLNSEYYQGKGGADDTPPNTQRGCTDDTKGGAPPAPKEDNKRIRYITLLSLFEEKIGNVSQLGEKSAFLDYWTEKSNGGKKERWEMEKVFDVKRRWNTWLRNKKAWEKDKDKSADIDDSDPSAFARYSRGF